MENIELAVVKEIVNPALKGKTVIVYGWDEDGAFEVVGQIVDTGVDEFSVKTFGDVIPRTFYLSSFDVTDDRFRLAILKPEEDLVYRKGELL